MRSNEAYRITLWSAVLLGVLCCGLYFGRAASLRAEMPMAPRDTEEQRTIDVYKATNEAVVFIATKTQEITSDPFDYFPDVQEREGSGSGVIVDAKKGIVVTNLHVLQGASQVEILLANGKACAARGLGWDEDFDIAVLQLIDPPPELVAVEFGDSSKLEVGQRVLAIGNPFGLSRTLTTGVISSLDRAVRGPSGRVLKGLVQTDAAINPGNSGGPLLDTAGRLIGINAAILSLSKDSAGIGFAVPVNQIKRVLPELIATGKVLRPNMGWVLDDTNQGPMVRRVLKGGPADRAGVEPAERLVSGAFIRGYVRDYERADLIFSAQGRRVYSKDDVEEIVSQGQPGKPITFVLRRGGIRGRERSVEIVPVLR